MFKNSILFLLIITMIFSVIPLGVYAAGEQDEFDLLREKWKDMLTGGTDYQLNDPNIQGNLADITQTAQSLWDRMLKNADRTSLWPGVTFGYDPGRISTTYNNLEAMALAYATVGSGLYQNQALLQDIISGLDWMDAKIYNPTKPVYQNWWHWQIGAPLALNNCTILIYEHLTQQQRANYMAAVAHFQNDISMTGANRLWECEVFTARGIISKDGTVLDAVKAGFSNLLGMVVSGDGFYEDGSFIQHNFYPYNGGYGKSLLEGIANLLYVLDSTSWDLNEIAKHNVYRWVYDAYEIFLYKGAFMDMVRGREIAREYAGTDYIGHLIMSSILRLSMIAPERDAIAFKSMVKNWLLSNPYKDYFLNASNQMIAYASAVLNDTTIVPKEELVLYRQFHHMDRAVQLRPGYGIGISMFSNRIGNFESINSENQKSYHTANGMVYLYNKDLLQYSDDFWPTVNLFRLPGTTVLKDSTVAANARSDKNWVGGTEIAGLYGTSGMELHPPGQSLTAKKSWFLFDDEMVALGADIQSTDGVTVETIAENRRINASNRFTVDDEQKPETSGWTEALENPSWAHLEGNLQGDIGYYFPGDATINALRETRTGSWFNMATAGSKTAVTSNYLTLWFDHGIDPTGGTYAYVTLPNKTAQETKDYAKNPNIVVLKNDAQVQAVKEVTQNVIGANFWTDTIQTVENITCNKKASVMTRDNGEEFEVSVSDPTQANTDWIDITIDKSAAGIISADKDIVVKQLSPSIRFAVNVSGAKGKSFQAKFALVDPAPMQGAVKDTYIIDNTDNGFSTDATPWTVSYTSGGYYGIDAASDNTAEADTDRWAKWTPDIIESDTYDVYMRWVSSSGAPDAAPLEIQYDGGVDTSKVVNQRFNNGVWVYIGSYPFAAGTGQSVKLHASDEGKTSADAVKFVARRAAGNIPLKTISVKPADKPALYRIAYEDFDSGDFSVENVWTGSNLTKKLLQKDGNTLLTAELNATTVSFETANPLYDEDLLAEDDGVPGKSVNTTQYFSTGPGRLTRNSGGEDIRIYYNLPQKITTKDRLIYVDVRLKKSLTESINMNICQDTMTSYSQAGGKTGVSFSVSKYTPSLIYYAPSKTTMQATKNFDFGEWIYVRSVIDLKKQKVTMYCGETLENMQPWAGFGSESTYDLNAPINGISSIYFKGKGTVAMDDLHIYAVESDSSPQISNAVFENGMLQRIELKNPSALPTKVNITAVLYDEKQVVKKVALLTDVAVNQAAETQDIILQNQIPYVSGCQLKIFVWESSAELKPLTMHYMFELK